MPLRTLSKIGLAATLTAALLTGCSTAPGGPDTSKLTIAMSVSATPWDIADAGGGFNEQQYQPVYDTVLRLDADGEVVPNVATEWSYDDAMTTLSLTIRDGDVFTDGEVLDAAAVKASLDHIRAGSGEGATLLSDVTDISTDGVDTVVLSLGAPNPSLLFGLAKLGGLLASPKALDNPKVPVGSGPYALDETATTDGRQYTFVRNEDYPQADEYPYDTVVLKPLTDVSAKFNALVSGQVDAASVPAQRVDAAKQQNLTLTTFTPGDIEGLFIFDRAGTIVPALGDVRVRRALNYAFDRDAIVETAKRGLGTVTQQNFNPSSVAFDADLNDTYTYDPEQAKALLAEAGYADGFSVTVPDLSSTFPEQQAAMTQQLADIGVTVTLETIPMDQLFSALLGGKYAMSLFKLASFTAWETVQAQFLSGGDWNPFGVTDPTVEALAARIQTAPEEDQTALFQELNAYLVEQAWNAPWDNVEAIYATNSSVTVSSTAFYSTPPIWAFAPAK